MFVNSELEKIDQLIESQIQVLFQTVSVFPFEFFPTTLLIDKTKVTVKYKIFFTSYQLKSLLIQDISNIEVSTSWLFATLKIRSRLPSEKVMSIKYLWKRDALEAQKIIQGLMVGIEEHIDVSRIPSNQLRKRAEQLGGT